MCFLFPARMLTDTNIRRIISLVISKHKFGHRSGLAISESLRELLRTWIPGPCTWSINSEEAGIKTHTVFLAAPLPILLHSHIWEEFVPTALGAAGPFLFISIFCFCFTFHSLWFHFGSKHKNKNLQHLQKLCVSSRKVISIRVGILANFFQV